VTEETTTAAADAVPTDAVPADGVPTDTAVPAGAAAAHAVLADKVLADTADGAVEILRALAHPVRWGILRRLAAEPGICACDFTEFFDVSQPTISAHLKVLREAGLVTTERSGTTICYRVAPARLSALARAIAQIASTAAPVLHDAPAS
jgi:ArsR family transcriptional regulator